MAGYRPSYTIDEDTKILELIIASKSYYMLRGTRLWKDLSAVGDLERSWMSLKTRFIKYILPELSNPMYRIPDLEKRKIELSWYQTSSAAAIKFKNSFKNQSFSSSDSTSSGGISDADDEEATRPANISISDDTDIEENTSTHNLNEPVVISLLEGDDDVNSANLTHNDPNAHSNDSNAQSNDPNAQSNDLNAQSNDSNALSNDTNAQSKDPNAHLNDPNAHSNDPNAHSNDPNAHSNDPSTNSNDPNAHSNDPNAHSNDPNAHSNDTNAHLNDPNAHSNDPNAHSNDPNAHSNDPNAQSNEPNAHSPSNTADEEQRLRIIALFDSSSSDEVIRIREKITRNNSKSLTEEEEISDGKSDSYKTAEI